MFCMGKTSIEELLSSRSCTAVEIDKWCSCLMMEAVLKLLVNMSSVLITF